MLFFSLQQIGKNEFEKAEKLIVGLKCDQPTRAVPDTDVAVVCAFPLLCGLCFAIHHCSRLH